MSFGSRSVVSARSQAARGTTTRSRARTTTTPRGGSASPTRRETPRPGGRALDRQRARARTRQRNRRLRIAGALAFLAVVVFLAVHGAVPAVKRAIGDLGLPLHDSSIIVREAAAKHLDPALVAAVIDAETGYDARTSPTGAEGLMQIEPATAEALARQSGAQTFEVADLGTPAVNIAYGSYYLRELLDTFGGNEIAALAAYNGGETNVFGWIAAARQAGHRFGLADIPFPATRDYVATVLADTAAYRRKYPAQLGLSH